MTPADPFQAEVARLALDVARRHGFALAGGHALIAHGVVSRLGRSPETSLMLRRLTPATAEGSLSSWHGVPTRR